MNCIDCIKEELMIKKLAFYTAHPWWPTCVLHAEFYILYLHSHFTVLSNVTNMSNESFVSCHACFFCLLFHFSYSSSTMPPPSPTDSLAPYQHSQRCSACTIYVTTTHPSVTPHKATDQSNLYLARLCFSVGTEI